jgi:hypothetical protein
MRHAASSRVVFVLATLAMALALLWSPPAVAHAASDGYLVLTFSDGPVVVGQWDLALRDLESAMPLGGDAADPARSLRPSDVRTHREEIIAFALAHLALHADGAPCPTTPGELAFTDHADAVYVALHFTATCSATPRVVALDYTLFFDRDPLHRGLTRVEDGRRSRSIVFSSVLRHAEITRGERDRAGELAVAVRSGVAHIAAGVDHILFLLALLLPAVLRREGPAWRPVDSLREAAFEVVKIVTAFTAAHSLTLSLAVLDVVRIPARVVEPAIAASILVAALQNLVRPAAHGRWRLAFALGLLHGFGFSAALVDLGLQRGEAAITLLGFNLGVELGQLVVVGVFLALAFRLRTWPLYRPVVLRLGSALIALVACVWIVQRALPSTILPAHASYGPAVVRPSRARRCGARERSDGGISSVCAGFAREGRPLAGAGRSHPARARAVR